MNKFSLFLFWVLCPIFALCQTDGSNLFNDNFLHEVRFENVDTVKFIGTENYQPVKMMVDGNVVDTIGFKSKGNISKYYDPNKIGIKVKTNKYVTGKEYDGIKEFTLHINYQDPTMLREKLTYDLCASIGLKSLRTAFAKVYINNVYWGLYTLVEGKDEMFKQVFDNRNADAIESLDFGGLCFISNNPNDYDYDSNGGLPTYILENGAASTAWPRFARMIDKANNTSASKYVDTVSNYLNLPDFFKYQAVNVYLMNMDSYIAFRGNQIFMYDTITSKWQVIPWDFNSSFGLWNTSNTSPSTYPIIPNAISNGCIADNLNTIPALKKYYLDAMCQLNTILGDTTSYFAKIDMWRNQIRQAVYDDTRKHVSNTDFENGINYGFHPLFNENQPALKTFLTQRNNVIRQGLTSLAYDCQTTPVTSIENLSKIDIYPNPASNYIRCKFEKIPSGVVQKTTIINAMGQAVLTNNSVTDEFNIESLPKGMYFIEISADELTFVGKFIKI